MSWHEAIIANLPTPASGGGGSEPQDLRRDILDELEDHLECAMRREFLRESGIDETTARRNVLKRFGDPAAVARKLWLDAMKGTLMNQRILIGTNILLAVIVVAMFIITLVSMQQNRQFQETLVNRLTVIPVAPSEGQPAGEAAAMSWPSARIRVEGGNPPFRLELQGEPYNPGEKITLTRNVEDGESVFGPMRPGRYTLNITDDHGARNSRSVVVPPGGEHQATVRAPDWRPQPTPTRVRLDLPDNLGERLGVIAVIGQMRGNVAAAPEFWNSETTHLAVTHDGRAARFEKNPAVPDGALWSHRLATRARATMYQLDPDDLGLEDTVTLDASLRYVADAGTRLLYLQPAEYGDGLVYREMLLREAVEIGPDEIASGEVRVTFSLIEEQIAYLRAALDVLEDACAAVGAQRALGRDNMCYILHGGAVGPADRQAGHRLLVVLPGGDGSADFRDFVASIRSEALARRGWLVAQAIAPVWSADQADQLVWPTHTNPWPGMAFSTEEFIDAIIEDVQRTHPLDSRHVYVLGWASGGPAAYAAAMQEQTRLRGAFVAMSVFRSEQLPQPENARGRSFYILHSPQDDIPMMFPQQARRVLDQAGARATLQTYEGGQGWHGDVYGMIRAGMDWLAETTVAERTGD